ncbi:MAG: putative DNA binding domain-containing protein [Nanoarchaeota archaeon]|nr:putative DNA binding domain-containing protein [Nanoarchaeota archaeon]MBU4456915.1 putative DNA binding domain-containing protein [Nanoarchaeota archaeon]MCG2719483.1 putative DNA binding domain-containing protein [Nanoarchaeota archaeon]
METGQLLEVIESGETQEVELKQSFHSSQDLSKLICGFANTQGGMIIIGVNTKRTIIGVKEDVDELQQKISASAQAVSPPLVPDIQVHRIEGKKVIAIVVQKAIDSIFHTFHGAIYVKVGSTLKKFEGNQLVDFLRNKQILCFDEISSDATIDDLDIEKIKEYLQTRNQEEFLKQNSVENFLLNSKLAAKNGNLKIKNATVLFFGKEPEKFFPQIEIKLAQFDGVEPVKIISHQLIQSDSVSSIEKSLSFLKKNLSKSIQITDKAKRHEKYEYPLEVIREAIVNAVAHRDYFSKDSIQIYLFTNRIEITSPGSLPTGLPKELFGTLSVRRNPIVYHLLRDYGYVEGLGSGVPRMINAMRNHGLRDPEFGIYERFFRIVLHNEQSKQKPIEEYADLNERQKKCIEFLKKYKSIKTKKYEELNNTSFGTAIAEITELLKFKYLKKVGSFRGAYYVLNEEKK